MLKRLRERAGSEKGFTLIELLVVMLILGILAAIAIPAFLNQKNKANDASSKVMARTMQTAIETYNTDQNTYVGATASKLHDIEGTIPASAPDPTNLSTQTYTVTAPASSSGNTFSITKFGSAYIRQCTIPSASADKGGCNVTTGTSGTW